MNAPSITVLMTVYNAGGYLKTAVDSVLRQSHKDFEFLVIDDGTTDGSLDFLASLNDARIRLHRNPRNVGQTASLNMGLSLARAPLLARMDADDAAYPGWLARQFEFMRRHPDCAVVSCAAVVINGHGRVYKKLRSPLSMPQMVLKSLFASPLNHVGSMMRREVILADGGYDENLRIAADYDLWSRLLRRGIRLARVRQVGVAIRAHQASVTASHKGTADIPEMCRIMGDNIRHYSGLDLNEAQLRLWWAYAYAPACLSKEEFNKARHLMFEVYGRIPARSIGCKDRDIRCFVYIQQGIFLLKALVAGLFWAQRVFFKPAQGT